MKKVFLGECFGGSILGEVFGEENMNILNKNNNFKFCDYKPLTGLFLTILLLLSAIPFTAAGNVSIYAYWVGVNKLAHTVTQDDLPQIMITGDSLAPATEISAELFKVISGSQTQKVSTLLKIENYFQDSFTKVLTLNTTDLLGDYTVNVVIKSDSSFDSVILNLRVNPKSPTTPENPDDQTEEPQDPPTPINHPPILNPIGDKYVDVGQTIEFTISATDADGDQLEYGAAHLYPGMKLNSGSGKFTWKPSQTGDYPITFTVTDGKTEDSETIVINVNDGEIGKTEPASPPKSHKTLNTQPVMEPIHLLHVNEDDTVSYKVSAADAENDSLTYEMASSLLPADSKANSNSKAEEYSYPNFNLKFNPQAGIFRFNPDYDFVKHPQKEKNISFRFRAYDGRLFSEWRVASIIVHDINQVPVFTEIPNQIVYVGNNLSFDLRANDADKEDVLLYKIAKVSPTTTSAAEIVGNKFSWTPKYHDLGIHTFTFSVTDGYATVEQEMKISVLLNPETKVPTPSQPPLPPPSHPPVPDEQPNNSPIFGSVHTQFGKEGQLLEFPFKISDKEGDKITLTPYSADAILPDLAPIKGNGVNVGVNVIEKQNGEFIIQLKPLYTFVKHPQKNRVFTLILEASDGKAKTVKEVNIVIYDVNQLPQFEAIGNQAVFVGESVSFTVNASDADAEDNLNYDVKNLPEGAKFNRRGFAWVPTEEQGGKYVVIFTVSDGIDLVSKNVQITVLLKEENNVPPEPPVTPPTNPPPTVPPEIPPVVPPPTTPPLPPITPPPATPPILPPVTPNNGANNDANNENGLDFFIKSAFIEDSDNNSSNEELLAQAFITVRNESSRKAEDVRAIVMIPELGIVQSTQRFAIDKNKNAKIHLALALPLETPAGTYLVKVMAKNDTLHATAYRQLTVSKATASRHLTILE